MNDVRPTRRGFLALGGAVTLAGCSSATGEIRRKLYPHTHNADAPLGEATGGWTYSFRRESYDRPAVADGTVYAVGTNDDELLALDAASGETNWRVPLGVGATTPPAVAEEYVLLQDELEGNENSLRVFHRRTGRLQYGFEYPVPRFGEESPQPVVVEGSAYVVGAHPDGDGPVLYEVR
jgi:outer membrane protein assembly factor BamB